MTGQTTPQATDGLGSLDQTGPAEHVLRTFEQAPIALVGTYGPEHLMVATNAAYRAVLGHHDLIGRPAVEAFPEAVGQRIFEIMDRIYETGEPVVATAWRYQLDLDGSGVPTDLYLDFSGGAMRDEEGQIVGTWFSVVDATERTLEQQRVDQEAARTRQRYAEALDEITRLQSALMPGDLPLVPGLDVAGSYLLAATDTAAGGDWFDAVIRPDGRVAAVVGDVVGHGVAASAVMGQLRAVLHERLLSGASLTASLESLDRFARRVPAAHATTVCVVEIDPGSGAATYCTAGHPPPLLISARNGSWYLEPTGAGPLATGAAFAVAETALDPDDALLLYTDGILERPGVAMPRAIAELSQVATDAAGNRGLVRGASTRAGERACQITLELLTRETGHTDDITLLAVQRIPAVTPLDLDLTGDLRSMSTARHALHTWMRQMQVTDRDQQAVQLAVSELVANAVEHGYAETDGSVRVHAALDPDGVLRIRVADDGTWQPPDGPLPASGRGLWMTGQVVEELRIDHEQEASDDGRRGTVVTVGQRLTRPALLATGPGDPLVKNDYAEFAVSVEEGPPRVLRVSGAVDFTTAARFADRLDIASRGGVYPLVVDLSAVDILASAGVRALFAARDQHAVHHRALTLVAAEGSPAQRVLDLVGLPYLSDQPHVRP